MFHCFEEWGSSVQVRQNNLIAWIGTLVWPLLCCMHIKFLPTTYLLPNCTYQLTGMELRHSLQRIFYFCIAQYRLKNRTNWMSKFKEAGNCTFKFKLALLCICSTTIYISIYILRKIEICYSSNNLETYSLDLLEHFCRWYLHLPWVRWWLFQHQVDLHAAFYSFLSFP